MEIGPDLFPDLAKPLFALGIAMLVVGLFLCLPFAKKWKAIVMSDKTKPDVVGLDIENSGGGTGMEINSHGTPSAPSVGAVISATGIPGQSVTGVRVTQNGPGTGMRVVQTGPRVGMRVVVTAPKDPSQQP